MWGRAVLIRHAADRCQLATQTRGFAALTLQDWLKSCGHEHALSSLSRTHLVYASEGCSLAAFSTKLRGTILEAAALERDRLLHPTCNFADPDICHTVNGRLRPASQRDFDWLRVSRWGNKIRVEHKSALVRWQNNEKRWIASWWHVKGGMYDELHLTLLTPGALYTFVHDGKTGIGSTGKYTEIHGNSIVLTGERGQDDVHKAVLTILSKAGEIGKVQKFSLHDAVMTRSIKQHLSRTHVVYMDRGCPLHSMSQTLRGRMLESIARKHDGRRLAFCNIENAKPSFARNGVPLPVGRREHDWIRVDKVAHRRTRVEHKSAQVRWESTSRIWKVQWVGVKPQNCDELQLTLYSPHSLRTFIYDGVLGLSTAGKVTEVSGKMIQVRGPKHEEDLDKATAALVEKVSAACGAPILELPRTAG